MELVQRLRSYLPKGYGSLWSRPSKDMALAADLIEKQAAELAEARAEIERKMSAGQFVLEQIAAEQANGDAMSHWLLLAQGGEDWPSSDEHRKPRPPCIPL